MKQHTVALARGRAARSEERPYCAVVATPFAQVGFRTHNVRIVGVQYLPRHVPSIAPATALAREARAQLEAYVRDPRRGFDLPCALESTGTAFQRAVWNAIATIPNAGTRTYGELARDLGSSARAMGIPILRCD